MTRNEVITFVRQIKPHDFENEVMLRWLDELEQKIATEIHQKYTRDNGLQGLLPDQLSVPVPYDRVYWTYLLSMIDFVSGSSDTYERSLAVFQEAYGEYARAVQRASGCRKKRSLS
ncbi:MAG: hypothetical protein IJC99_07115 [Clostridia bacterium]|nr:hypothetical protein [Clostridia bacterium]